MIDLYRLLILFHLISDSTITYNVIIVLKRGIKQQQQLLLFQVKIGFSRFDRKVLSTF
jgi:hypothetical protein